MWKINKQKKNIRDNIPGFTLVEVLVSFAVMTIATLGIFSLIIQNIQVQDVNKNYLVASMLAQEGLELVRSVRDETWLDPTKPAPKTWDNLVDNTGYVNDDFIIDQENWGVETVNAGDLTTITDDPACRLNMVGGFYQHGGAGVGTQFYRIIEMTPGPVIPPNTISNYINVVSRVEWLYKGHVKRYIAETLLYDWR